MVSLLLGKSCGGDLCVSIQSSFPIANLKAVRRCPGHDTLAPSLHQGAMVTPQRVVEEEHLVVGNAGLVLEDREVRFALVGGERRRAADLHVPLEPFRPAHGKDLPHGHSRHHFDQPHRSPANGHS
eukprot:scaffold1272_cov250-Pinguiococcus_pyrenoidosus.AAC.36